MFTGIIEKKGVVRSLSEGEVPQLIVAKPESWEFKLGASIAVDGVCLTVVEQTKDSFSADVVPETLARTTMKQFEAGRMVNLERPLRMGDEIGGHIVQGHVDTKVKVASIEERSSSREISLDIPFKYMKFVIEKRSITVNGVSLTIALVGEQTLTIALVPHTLQQTNLGSLSVGDEVNVEFDTSVYSVAMQKKK